jgi:hypothetical protein
MGPSWDSLPELKSWSEWLTWWGIVGGALGTLVILGISSGYGIWLHSINRRIDEIENAKAVEAESTIAGVIANVPLRTGLLTPGPDPPGGIADEPSTTITLGDCTVILGPFPKDIIRQSGESILSVDKTADGLSVSGKFFTKEGKIVCELVNNVFHLMSNQVLRHDQGPHKLAIFGDEAQRVFEIEFVHRHAIRLVGDFYARSGLHFVIGPERMLIQNSAGRTIFYGSGTRYEYRGAGGIFVVDGFNDPNGGLIGLTASPDATQEPPPHQPE